MSDKPMTKEASELSTQQSTERLRLEFNDWAKAGRGPSMEKGHRPVGEQAIELMRIDSSARVIDVGCGSGWASRVMAAIAHEGRVVGIDVSDEMVRLARDTSQGFSNVEFRVASAEALPFDGGAFTYAFSMESIYYYADMPRALNEIRRVLQPGGRFITVVDLYEENKPTHQWIEQLKVPVHLLSVSQYIALFENAGFTPVQSQRLYDPRPVAEDYQGGSFKTRQDYLDYREAGSLMLTAEVPQ